MEQLISMRQRIKSVQTIQKITQAMRLISISTHSRLSSKKLNLENYKKSLIELYQSIQGIKQSQLSKNLRLKNDSTKNLIILVGSQKGLSGPFNSHLFKYVEKDYNLTINDELITVGKNVSDYIKKTKNLTTVLSYDIFSSSNFPQVPLEITNFILKNNARYRSVILFANYPKSFFIQEPRKSILWPLQPLEQAPNQKNHSLPMEYEIEEPDKLLNSLEKLILSTVVQSNLFNSLLAEQAARFLSMDTATRNADNLITTMKTNYNKLRQASITKELTEVTAGLGA